MKYILLLALAFNATAEAALSIKPGLWTIEMKMKKDGKEFDPQAKMKEAMAKMSPQQKKQIQEMMAKMGGKNGPAFGMNEKGMQVCFTGKSLQNEEFLHQHRQSNCETTFPVKSPTRVVTEFKCKNGTKGSAEWKVKDSTHYQGAVRIIDGKGAKSEIDYLGTFASEDCGNVKPIEEAATKPAKK